MPLFHVHGLVASTLSTLLSGGTVVVPDKFNPLSFWRTVRDYRRDLVFRGADDPPAAAGARGRRTAGGRGGPALHPFLQRVAAAGNDGEDGAGLRRAGAGSLRHDGSVASDGVESSAAFASANPDRSDRAPASRSASWTRPGICLPHGERGEVVIQGPNVVAGYENNPEANAKSFTNGWFRTGDQGFLDADGYLTLTGRIKELINRGGEKIGPREIDEVLLTHPAVAEAVCLRRAAPDLGRRSGRGGGAARSRQTEAAILAFCKERLADFKRPKKIYITNAIPRTATGKIQRGAVAKALARGLSAMQIPDRRRGRDRRVHRRVHGARRPGRHAVRARRAPARRCRSAGCA